MSLYSKLDSAIVVNDFLADTMLFVGGVLDWEAAFGSYPLDADEVAEHQASIRYWISQAQTHHGPLVRMVMRENLATIYSAVDRGRIDEATFKRLAGVMPTTPIARKLPFSADTNA